MSSANASAPGPTKPSAMHQAFLRSPFVFTLGLVLVLAALGVGAYFLATDVLLGGKDSDTSGGGSAPGSTAPPVTTPPATSAPVTSAPGTLPPGTLPPSPPSGTDSPGAPAPPGGGEGGVVDSAKTIWDTASVGLKIGIVAGSVVVGLALIVLVALFTGFGRRVLDLFSGRRGGGSDGTSKVVMREVMQGLGTADLGRQFRSWEGKTAQERDRLLQKAKESKGYLKNALEKGPKMLAEAREKGEGALAREISKAMSNSHTKLKQVEKEVAVLEAFASDGGTLKRMRRAVEQGERARGGALTPEAIARMNARMGMDR